MGIRWASSETIPQIPPGEAVKGAALAAAALAAILTAQFHVSAPGGGLVSGPPGTLAPEASAAAEPAPAALETQLVKDVEAPSPPPSDSLPEGGDGAPHAVTEPAQPQPSAGDVRSTPEENSDAQPDRRAPVELRVEATLAGATLSIEPGLPGILP